MKRIKFIVLLLLVLLVVENGFAQKRVIIDQSAGRLMILLPNYSDSLTDR